MVANGTSWEAGSPLPGKALREGKRSSLKGNQRWQHTNTHKHAPPPPPPTPPKKTNTNTKKKKKKEHDTISTIEKLRASKVQPHRRQPVLCRRNCSLDAADVFVTPRFSCLTSCPQRSRAQCCQWRALARFACTQHGTRQTSSPPSLIVRHAREGVFESERTDEWRVSALTKRVSE